MLLSRTASLLASPFVRSNFLWSGDHQGPRSREREAARRSGAPLTLGCEPVWRGPCGGFDLAHEAAVVFGDERREVLDDLLPALAVAKLVLKPVERVAGHGQRQSRTEAKSDDAEASGQAAAPCADIEVDLGGQIACRPTP